MHKDTFNSVFVDFVCIMCERVHVYVSILLWWLLVIVEIKDWTGIKVCEKLATNLLRSFINAAN